MIWKLLEVERIMYVIWNFSKFENEKPTSRFFSIPSRRFQNLTPNFHLISRTYSENRLLRRKRSCLSAVQGSGIPRSRSAHHSSGIPCMARCTAARMAGQGKSWLSWTQCLRQDTGQGLHPKRFPMWRQEALSATRIGPYWNRYQAEAQPFCFSK